MKKLDPLGPGSYEQNFTPYQQKPIWSIGKKTGSRKNRNLNPGPGAYRVRSGSVGMIVLEGFYGLGKSKMMEKNGFLGVCYFSDFWVSGSIDISI